MPQAPIATPCQNICKIDRQQRFCLGCFRSLGEIAAWVRLAVMAALPARRQRYHIVGSHITISGT